MECLQNRIDSFSKTKRVKNPNKPSSNLTLKWPHPASFTANPDTLAEAGFYYSPSAEDPDNVSCFMCEKQLSDWEEDDDPFDIHYDKCANKCAWANIRCGLRRDMDRHGRFVFPDKSRLPTSKAMEKARLETFTVGDGWIHDSVRGHGASSKKLARAGFVLTANFPGDDLATCLYCNVSLSGWDKDDDPMEEHRKRKDKSGYPCPLFPRSNGEPPSSDSGQPSAKPASKASTSKPPSSRSTSKSKVHQDMVMPTKTFDGDPDGTDYGDASDQSAKSSTSKTPARKSRAASGSSTRKSTAKTPKARSASKALKEVIELDEDEEEDEPVEPPTTVKKKRAASKARSKTVILSAATEMDEDVEEPVVAPPTTAKKKGSRAKSVARSVASEVEEIVEEPAAPPPTTAKKKKATTARSRSKSVARSEKMEQSDAEEDAPAVEKTVKKPSRSKGKAKAPVQSETDGDEPEEEEEPVPRKSSRAKVKATPATTKKATSKSKGKSKVVEPELEPEPEEPEDDGHFETAAEEPEPPKTRTSKKPASKSTAAKKSKKVQQQEKEEEESRVSEDEFGPIIEQPHFAPAVAAKPKPPSTATKKQPLAGASALGKGKPPSSRGKPALPPPPVESSSAAEDDDDADELESYVPPPSSPPRLPAPASLEVANDGEEDMELTPLVIPKRTTTASKSKFSGVQDSLLKQATKVRPSQAGKLPASTSSKVRVSITKMQNTAQMKVVDVLSSDDDDDNDSAKHELPHTTLPDHQPEPAPIQEKERDVEVEIVEQVQEVMVDLQKKTKGKSKKGAAQAKKSLMFTSTAIPDLGPEDATTPVAKKAVTAESSSSSIQPFSSQSQQRGPEEPLSQQDDGDRISSGDVSMQETEIADVETQLFEEEDDTKMHDGTTPSVAAPRTPPRARYEEPVEEPAEVPPSRSSATHKPNGGVKQDDVEAPEPSGSQQLQAPPFFPPLSKLPFVPIPELTEAELDMTVEEWIRYQTEVEYDKFRRDGERELQRLRKEAERTRKVIEGL
ncbi:hypothetical protein DFP72DRAFT_1002723 [Ephemerocybe angulata]|uniref:Protein bir1 n=1 Tax=Ephemerocybe angulata TaxID=980116 RepID=A0A8H6ME57_9AGAR|nr:hypothetical protein DFP72DRAFT_1002723 [Tulosesus angulatus]